MKKKVLAFTITNIILLCMIWIFDNIAFNIIENNKITLNITIVKSKRALVSNALFIVNKI